MNDPSTEARIAAEKFDQQNREFQESFLAECERTAAIYDEIAREFRLSKQGDREWRIEKTAELTRKAAAFRAAAIIIRENS